MAAFQYIAVDINGKQKKGVLEGDNARQVRHQLREKSWVPVSVEPVIENNKESAHKWLHYSRKVKAADLALLTRQLASLVQSGMPLEQCLKAVAEQSEKNTIKSKMMEVRSGVMEGHTLASSLKAFPETFSPLYRSTVAAGEQSGHLEKVLERLADYTEQRYAMRQKIQLALLYPGILTTLSLLIVAGLLAYVVPSVVKVFADTGQSLPFLTQALIGCSDFVKAFGLWVILLLVVLGVATHQLLKGAHYRQRFHHLLLMSPFVSKVIKGLETSRFCRTLSILMSSGVPLIESLKIAAEVLGNLSIKSAVTEAMGLVREGSSLNRALSEAECFPPMALHMIASGEASGDLEAMLARVADYQDREFESLVNTLMGLVGPLLVVMMGGIVLIIVLAILLPIFELNQLVT